MNKYFVNIPYKTVAIPKYYKYIGGEMGVGGGGGGGYRHHSEIIINGGYRHHALEIIHLVRTHVKPMRTHLRNNFPTRSELH